MSRYAQPCIICERELRNVMEDCDNQPYNGTTFQSQGHYGSTIFDPMDGLYLELNICDPCLVEKRALILEGKKTTTVTWKLTPWQPTEEGIAYAIKVGKKEMGREDEE